MTTLKINFGKKNKFWNLESRTRISSLYSRSFWWSLSLEGYGLDYIIARGNLDHGHHISFSSEVAGVTFSDSDSAPDPKFLNPDPGPAIFQIWESDSCSASGYNHRSNRKLPKFLLNKWPHRLLLLPKGKSDSGSGSVFSQIFDSGSWSEWKTQNPAGVDSGNPDPVPSLVLILYCRPFCQFCMKVITTVVWTWWRHHGNAKDFETASVWLHIFIFGSFQNSVWLLHVKKIWQPCADTALDNVTIAAVRNTTKNRRQLRILRLFKKFVQPSNPLQKQGNLNRTRYVLRFLKM